MSVLTSLLAFLVTLAILIVVHELGHYWAARRCGVKVLRFSVGFGRPLFKVVRGADRTEWVVASLPLGGYVRMLDERDEDCGPIAPEDLPRAFNRKSVWARSFIVVAGPLANFVLAAVVYWLLAVIGTVEPQAVLAAAPAGSVADRAGVRAGDVAVQFNGADVRSMNELRWQLLKAATTRGEFGLQVQSGSGVTRDLSVLIAADDVPNMEGDVVGTLGFALAPGPARIRRVAQDLPAAQAGLREGDELLSVDGHAVHNALDAISLVRASPDVALAVDVLREGRRETFALKAGSGVDGKGQRIGRIGVEFVPGALVQVREGPIEGVARAVVRTWDMAAFSLRMLVRMVQGDVSWRNLSGPVTMADYAGQTARVGWVPYLAFLALVSVGLGVLNLLPIPLLDGGHLLYHAAEIFIGKPPAQWLVDWGQRAGAAALLMLTALALYNDLTRLLS